MNNFISTIPSPFAVCILLAFILVVAWLNDWFPKDPEGRA